MNTAYKMYDSALVEAKGNDSSRDDQYNSAARESVITEVQENMDRNDMRKFYAAINGGRYKTAPVFTICNDREGNLITYNAMLVTPK